MRRRGADRRRQDRSRSSAEIDTACGTGSDTYNQACRNRDVKAACSVVANPGAIVKRIEEKLP